MTVRYRKVTFPSYSAPVRSCIKKKNILRQPYQSLSDIVILFSYSDCSNGIGFGCASSHDEHGKKGAIKFAKQVELAAAADKKSGSDGSYPRQLLRSWTKARVVAKNKGMPGELGKAVAIPPDKEEEKKEKFKINQFNLMASDMISLNRSLQDVRMSQCKSKVSRRLFSVVVFSSAATAKIEIGLLPSESRNCNLLQGSGSAYRSVLQNYCTDSDPTNFFRDFRDEEKNSIYLEKSTIRICTNTVTT